MSKDLRDSKYVVGGDVVLAARWLALGGITDQAFKRFPR